MKEGTFTRRFQGTHCRFDIRRPPPPHEGRPIRIRKRVIAAVLAVGLVGTGAVNAAAELAPVRTAFAAAPWQRPAETTWAGQGELNMLMAAHRQSQVPDGFIGDDGELITAGRVRAYLDGKGSPLAAHAQAFIDAGIANDVDPRAVISISGIESSFGTRQRGHNAWGWMGGPGGSLSRWSDWDTAIHAYTAKLASRYDVRNIDERFARRYVPPNWQHWLEVVHTIWREI